MKKCLLLLLAFSIAITTSACGNKEGTSKDDIDMGKMEHSNISIMGVTYDLYKNGYAYIEAILHENAVLTEKVDYEDKEYIVIGIGDRDASAGRSGARGVFGMEYSGIKSPENLILPESIKFIEVGALQYSTAKSIVLPDGIIRLKTGVFRGCSNLEIIEFPDSLTQIDGLSLFSGCHSLKSVEFPETCVVGSLDSCFNDCFSLETVVVPDTLDSISDSAFCNCTELSSVYFGQGVTEIGTWAFSNCPKLETLIIPDSVTVIGDKVFHNCPGLKDLTLPDGLTDVPANLFLDQYNQAADVSNLTIRVEETMVSYVQSIYPEATVVAKQ